MKTLTLSTISNGAVDRAINDLKKSFLNGKAKALAIAETIIIIGQKTGDYQRFNGLCKAVEEHPSVLRDVIAATEGRIPHTLRKKPNGDYLGRQNFDLLASIEQLEDRRIKKELEKKASSAKRADGQRKKAELLANAEATADSLAEAKKDLAEARRELAEARRELAEAKKAAAAAERAAAAEVAAINKILDETVRDFNSIKSSYEALKIAA